MVTVLQGDELEALGVRNVWEALSLVPGVQSVRDVSSSPLLLVRGINFIFNSGNIRILVDSVALNQESAGINSSILLMPIEDVERIEFMRGPGSAIHGDAAYLGLLNIITRREERRVFGTVETDSLGGGAHVSWADTRSDGRFAMGFSGFSNRDVDGKGPGKASEAKGFGRFFASWSGLSLSVEALDADHTERAQDGGAAFLEKSLAAELRYARDLTPKLHVEAYGSILRNDDVVGAKEYDGRAVHAGLDRRLSAPGRHDVLVTLGILRTDIFRGRLTLPPLFDLTIHDARRNATSVAVQDQWELTKALTLTAGLRLDDYDDIGKKITSRFAEGFRSPAFFELDANRSASSGPQPPTFPGGPFTNTRSRRPSRPG